MNEFPDKYRGPVQFIFAHFIRVLQTMVPVNADLNQAYENGSEEEQLFVARLALFLGTFLKSFLPVFEHPDGSLVDSNAIQTALVYMIHVSEVNDEEVFKTCLEFWYHFSKELYTADINSKTTTSAGNLQSNLVPGMFGGSGGGGTYQIGNSTTKHNQYEQTILHPLRIVMIDRMAKPEEVIIVEDENGEIVREQTKDTEVIAQYKTMKEALVYLTHLNYEDTEAIMLEKLDLQVAGGMFTWNGLNTLCWAIGSISGAMGELDEKRFLVSVIKDLLRLCEEQRGKDNKAVVASNIMYIVGQYPRFLRAHWKFLKTVVNKLFEFMHEHHPGVQDMACDTFLKIAQKCKRKFMTPQVEDPQPFILTLIADLPRHTMDLQPHQVQSFYESVGTMLSDQGPAIFLARDQVMFRLMESTNTIWQGHMARAASSAATSLLESDTLKELSRILKINAKVCTAAGAVYLHQLGVIFRDMLNVYRYYGEQIVAAVAAQGPIAVRHTQVKLLRGVKGDILDVFTAAVEVCAENREQDANGHEIFLANFMPGILEDILRDYQLAPPAARDSKVLSFFAAAIGTLKDSMSAHVPAIMEAVFEKTLEIITKNMEDHPEHRAAFFTFLRVANAHCFYGLFSIPAPHQKMVVESIIWAVKHTERNISETGLEILMELLQNVSNNPSVAQSFYASFLVSLIQDIFGVLTDRLHKSGFKLQASVLKHLAQVAQTGQVVAPLHSIPGVDNATFLREHISNLLNEAFPNLGRPQVSNFVRGLFDVSMDLMAFKQHLRDFLIAVKEFAGEDNSELFTEELEMEKAEILRAQQAYMASVPGLTEAPNIDFDPEL
jgi:exportin-1